jgi:oxygen-dependent protoporphyrinogen oxidase
MSTAERRVAVVGGGIAGLTAAHALAADGVAVTLFERDARLGGKVHTSPFAGHPGIDEGPDAFLARLPWGTELARRVGLGDDLVSPAAAKAAVFWKRLHDIPQGLLLGMPTDVMALARSRLISWPGKLRAATEPMRRRTTTDPDSLGAYVRSRFGSEVHVRLVDPLVGSIYAADTDHFSLAAVPQIADLAAKHRSVLVAGRHLPPQSPDAGPVFYAPRDGMGQFAQRVADEARRLGAQLDIGRPVHQLVAADGQWRLDDEAFDAVVLACPAPAASQLLHTVSTDAANALATVPTADVAMVTLAVPDRTWPEHLRALSGYLVPKPRQRLVTAASFGSQKWRHWALPGAVIIRVSLGRDGLPVLHLSDQQLVDAAIDEVGHHLGIDLQPTDTRITRWPGAFPQYRPHHAALIAGVESHLPPGLALAGASYHGIGIPACIHSASRAAAAVGHRPNP